LSAWHNHSEQKTDCWRQTHVTTFERGALQCFCPRAPKTLVTPLPVYNVYVTGSGGAGLDC